MFNANKFVNDFNTQGYSIVENVLSEDYIQKAKSALLQAIDLEADYHGNKEYNDYGMVMLCSLYDKVFSDIFDNPRFTEPFHSILGEGCIVYAYTSSSMPPEKKNYSARIHVDCPRIIPGYVTNMGATILLDDFTEDNGATWFLPNSFTRAEAPSNDEFYDNAKRLTAKAGSVWYFNARTWHAGGSNFTKEWRHALTVNMIRPWMKQRIDIPRAMEKMDLSTMSTQVKQKLGFLAQVPANYDEYYVPFEQRKYKQATE